MKKKKINKRNSLLLIIIPIVLITIILLIYYGYQKKLVKQIKDKYSNYVLTNKNIKLYKYINKKYQPIGEITSNLSLELAPYKAKKDKYFKLKNSNYYIFYNDINKKIKSISKEEKENYLPLNISIKIPKNKYIYQNNKKVLKIAEDIKIIPLYKDDEFYYIDYLNHLFAIKQSDCNIEKQEVSSNEEATKISVLYYQTKPSDESFQETEKLLATNKLYTISLNEYQEWLKGNILLKKGAIILISSDETFTNKDLNINQLKNTNIKLVNNNKVSDKNNKLDSISSYYITNETTKEYFTKIINQESFTYPVKTITKTTPGKRNLVGNATSIPVINYHFFYDPRLNEGCNESNCLSTEKFEEQLKYLQDNGFKTLTIQEFRKWLYNEIELPAKSVLLTIDDGAMGTGKHNGNKLIPLLEKYNSYATLFLITGWWARDNYNSPNLNVESHTHDMHTERICKTEARGAKMLCSTYEEIVADLQTSININQSNEAFCYPFFVTNEKAISAVKNLGFKMAFVGGSSYATRSSDKYKIPRFPIQSSITLEQFINIVG